jgi:hypothetical protein
MLSGGFVYDDGAAISKNADVSGNSSISSAFIHDCEFFYLDSLTYTLSVCVVFEAGFHASHMRDLM